MHSKYFSYKELEKTIDKLSFETEILLLVNKSESEYLSEFIDDILRKNTDTKAKIILDNIFTELNEHIDKLSNLKLNTYQELVAKIFCKSYLNIYRALLKKFSEFYTDYLTTFEEILINLNTGYIERFDDIEDLAYFIFPKNHKQFIEYEYKLKKHDFLNENLKWISKKNDLVRFYKYLEPKKIFIPLGKNPFTRTLKCLEKRYSININKSKETFKFNIIEDKKSIFSFLNDLE